MKAISFLIFLLTFSVHADFVEKNVSFEVNPNALKNKVHYGVEFYKNSKPSFVRNLDVEGVSNKDSRVTIFFKSALIIDRSIDQIDFSEFEKSSVHAHILDGSVLKKHEDNPFDWRMQVKILVKNVNFDYQAFLTKDVTDSDKINQYIDAAEDLDRNLPQTEYYLIQYLDKYNVALDRMITLSKIIPYKGKTMVVTYQLSHLYKSFYKKYNIFNSVKRVFEGKLKKTIERTRDYLSK